MEVPIVGSDAVQWIEVNVPRNTPAQHDLCASPPRDAAGCFTIASSSDYVIWRVHKDLPNVLELMEWSFRREPPRYGLHITFQDSLFPFVSIFKHQMNNTAGNLLLYAITTSGFVYVIKLKSLAAYRSGEILHNNELIQLDLSENLACLDKITAVTVAAGILCVGGQNGYILCHQLGQLDQSAHDCYFELKDGDGGLGRLWGLVSRGKTLGMIKSLATSEIHGKRLLFALHDDGNLRIWDLFNRSRIFIHFLGSSELSGFRPSMLYTGEKGDTGTTVSMIVLYKSLSEANLEKVVLCKFNLFSSDIGGRGGQSVQQRSIPLEQGNVIDMRLSSDGLWVLKEGGSALYELFYVDLELGGVCNYVLQESWIANEILQSSEFDVDNLILVHHFIYSSFKNEVPPSVSAIFLRRLMQSGVRQRRPLQEVMGTRKKHLSDSDFRSFTVDGLRKEILSVIECEGIADNQISLSYEWKSFCNIYMQSWCHNNVPYGLLFDSSTGSIGVIRRHSLSLNRSLCDIEQIVHGMSMVDGKISALPSNWKHNTNDAEILDGILKCTGNISRYLGKAALAVFYEALIKPSSVTFQYLISRFLKILDVGYDFSVLKQHRSHLGLDFAHEKENKYHSHQRKFSLSMMFSLQALRDKAGGWDRVLNVIEKFLSSIVPEKFSYDKRSTARGILYSVNMTLLMQTVSQVAEIQFETARDLLLLLSYLVKIKGQLNMELSNVSRIELQLIPRVHEVATRSFLLYWMSTTSTEAPSVEDFSLQLSSLHIVGDGKNESRTWEGMLGTGDLTLIGILICGYSSSKDRISWMSTLQSPDELLSNAWKFISWILWGENGNQSENLSIRIIALSTMLLQYGQYGVLENLFVSVDEHSDQQKLSRNSESMDGEWCARLHLMGFCLLARARLGLQENLKEKQIEEAIHCFFRAASGEEASQALQELTVETGLEHSGLDTTAGWKLHYYEWVMQIFDQQNLSAGACQFARAALEQVDEALGVMDQLDDDTSLETASNIKGRLWANVFKFSMDLKQYSEAYCAIVSNPDEESKLICLRRFIIMLCEDKATQILCDSELPFVGLLERVERELVWKAECSDIIAKPNPYKLLYAFHTHRHNWRRAAGYIYRYTVRMKEEGILRMHMELSFALNERLQGLSAAINALHLVDPAYAWIDSPEESSSGLYRHSPTKRARKYIDETSENIADEIRKQNYAIDIEQLEKEYVLTLAQLELVAANVKHSSLGGNLQPADVVLLLIQSNLNEIAFSVIFKFWKDSSLKRELEKVFQIFAQKCCASKSTSLLLRDSPVNVLLIPSSAKEDEISIDRMCNNFQTTQYINSKTAWNVLQSYLEKYIDIHPRLPVVVAETLLHTDPQINLPLWLVDMLKGGRKATAWGMAGHVSDPAALLRLYMNYGRFSEATYLLLEYIEAWSSLRPADIVKRKKMSAVWFPYTSVERLYFILSEMIKSGQMIEQCQKLQKLLHAALLGHLKQLKVDSDDAQSSAL